MAPTMHNRMIKSSIYLLEDNVNTDQILTAEFMKINPSTAEGYRELGSLAMSGLPESAPAFVDPQTGLAHHKIIIAGDNFGCGSSREHAPVALGASGVSCVVAKSFARIFYRNCISTGELMPIECPTLDLSIFQNGDEVEVDIDRLELRVVKNNMVYPLCDFGELGDVIDAGGLFAYAKKMGQFKSANPD